MKNFEGRVAVVTGAASGIGKSYAERCAREGMKVVLADIEEGPLAQVEASLRASGAQVLAVKTDVSKADSVQALANQAVQAFGGVHLVFNNAGVADTAGLIWERPLKDWEWVMGVNYYGVLHGVRTFTPLLLAQNEETHIVNTASIAGLIFSVLGIYSVTKHAIVSLSEALYLDLQKVHARVGVSVVCPFWVKTNILTSVRNRPAELQVENRPPTPEELAGLQVVGKLIAEGGSPDFIADCVFEAIQTGQFYVVPTPETKGAISMRANAILNGGFPANIIA
jgi:NAD(P)-dependent dehydrogenase (short-subunit alcohol dehydrogenase family)